MRIGILTFHFADNYGALLQAYALQRFLRKQECEVGFIDHVPEKERAFYSVNPFLAKGIKGKIRKIITNAERIDSKKQFDKFRKHWLSVECEYKAEKLNGQYDFLIVGSDQVWNEDIVCDLKPYLFAENGINVPKISYAASIGKKDVSDREKTALKRYLADFKAVSVRENESEELLSELGIRSTTVADPVFLLNPADWEILAFQPQGFNNKKPFVLLYFLREDAASIEKADHYAKMKGFDLYYVHPLGRKLKHSNGKRIKNVGPFEFIWLIKNAERVFTNSFHAVSFSIILGTPFVHCGNDQLGNRVQNLLDGIDCVSTEDGEALVSDIDAERLKKQILDSVGFIKQVLFEEG